MPTGRATTWPNRAKTAARLFKRQYEKLLHDATSHPALAKVTLRDLVTKRCWARNTTLTISGYTPVELATGRRPTDHADLELMKPDQLSNADFPRDVTLAELKKLALHAPLEARHSADLRLDLARRILPPDGPYHHGLKVFVRINDKAKCKAVGGKGESYLANVTVEKDKAVLSVNRSKTRRDHDPWRDVPLPRSLEAPEKNVPLETDEAEEDTLGKESSTDSVENYVVFASKICSSSFAVANVSFANAFQVLEVSIARCSMTPLLVDYGLQAGSPFDLNHASNCQSLH